MTGIYYADLFEINNKGCLVMGCGKTKTCRHYTGNDTVMICNDSIRLEKVNNELFGYADPAMGMGLKPFDKNKAKSTKIEYLIRMLSEEETKEMKCTKITTISKDEYAELSDFNITFRCENVQARRHEFRFLVDGVDLTCIIVPWCDDMDTKGALIGNFVH